MTSTAISFGFQVESYWDECLALPSKLKDWDAYTVMKSQIQQYLDVFPLLHKLASKVSSPISLTVYKYLKKEIS